ncbi:hypothetical protein [Pandoraea oxalativorans]|uniref:Bacterial shufflon protein N-terminal domain-containing protein n=1 Tax=Pandoraea oxalativorans TaxID=573737 RepID=A0A0E3YAC1_9BURK|nr:hypothetical protein [Pandoraea oxalativorans]AKC68766.1 hypothetical protein MB84_03775 [Pandoraea oxalativorans]
MRKKQTGAFLISAAIAVAILGVLISFWGVNYARQMRIERAERIGEALKVVGDRVQSFVVEHHHEIDALLRGTATTLNAGDVTFHRATDSRGIDYIGDLTAAKLIEATHATGIGERPPGNVGNYVIRVYLGCDDKNTNCNVETLTYIEKPIPKSYSSDPDMDAAATAARKIGALGGISTRDTGAPFRFLGTGGSRADVPNPHQIPGLVAMRGGYSTSAADVFLRRDGSRAMTGDLKMDKHDIVGAGKITGGELSVASASVTGTLDLGSATIKGGLNLTDPKTKARSDIVGARDIRGDGKLTMGSLEVASAKVDGPLSASSVRVGGDLRASSAEARTMTSDWISADTVTTKKALKSGSGVVVLEKEYRVGGACGGVGGIERSASNGIALDARGRVLSCQGGSWQLASAPKTVTEVPDPIIQVIRKNEAMWLSIFTPDQHQGMSSVRGALACAMVDVPRTGVTTPAFISAGADVGSPEITLQPDGSISFYRSALGATVACLSRSQQVKGKVYSINSANTWTYLDVAPREQFASDSFEFQDRATAIFTRRQQEHVVMGIWKYAWSNCRGSYRGRMKGALACTVMERDWCYSTSGGSRRASVDIDTDGTPIVDFGNTYGEVTCAFPTKAHALAAGFSVCGYDGNNCAAKW